MARLKDIAQLAGVTPAVVSRLLNGDTRLRVSADTRSRVLRIAKELNYSPNLAAQTLRRSHSNLIAMAVHDIFNPVYAKIEEGAQAAARDRGYLLMIADPNSLGDPHGYAADLIRGGALGGLILQGTGATTDMVLQRAVHNRLPTVLLQERGDPELAVVRLPDEQAGRLAAEHLISLGHTRIGCLGAREGLQLSLDRAAGWRNALATNGISASEKWLTWSGSNLADGFDGMTRLLRQAPDITAVVVCNVMAALGAISAAVRNFERRIPDTLSLVAVHDIALAEHSQPPITVVDMPLRALGYCAVALLLDKEPHQERQIVVNDPAPKLIPRHSTRALQITNA